jgi:hypothetical protein
MDSGTLLAGSTMFGIPGLCDTSCSSFTALDSLMLVAWAIAGSQPIKAQPLFTCFTEPRGLGRLAATSTIALCS